MRLYRYNKLKARAKLEKARLEREAAGLPPDPKLEAALKAEREKDRLAGNKKPTNGGAGSPPKASAAKAADSKASKGSPQMVAKGGASNGSGSNRPGSNRPGGARRGPPSGGGKDGKSSLAA